MPSRVITSANELRAAKKFSYKVTTLGILPSKVRHMGEEDSIREERERRREIWKTWNKLKWNKNYKSKQNDEHLYSVSINAFALAVFSLYLLLHPPPSQAHTVKGLRRVEWLKRKKKLNTTVREHRNYYIFLLCFHPIRKKEPDKIM